MSQEQHRDRRHARELAMQALYQWSLSKTSLTELRRALRKYARENDRQPNWEYFDTLLAGVLGCQPELDEQITMQSDVAFSRLSQVELAILRLGAYELRMQNEVPPAVVIDEAVELSKKFGAEGSYKFVNALLDKLWTKTGC